MTYQEVNTFVESLGFPCAYYQFTQNTAVPPPFICWLMEGDDERIEDKLDKIEGDLEEISKENRELKEEIRQLREMLEKD